MNVLIMLAVLVGVVVAISLLGEITEGVNDYITRTRDEALALSPLPDKLPTPKPALAAPVSPPQRAAWWWQRFLSPRGMLGLLLSPFELVILLINSYLIAVNFEVIFRHPGPPLFVLTVWGWEREVTIFDLYGVLISLAEMISASAYHLEADDRHSLVRQSALVALVSLVGFEVGTAVARGWLMGGPENAIFSGLFALGIAASAIAVGILVFDRCLVPLLLAMVWSISSPLWALVGWWERRKPRWRWAYEVKRNGNAVLQTLAWPLVLVDRSVMAPLRRLDDGAARLIAHMTEQSRQEGGDHNAKDKQAAENQDTAAGPAHGGPAGVRRNDPAASTADRVDRGAGHHNLNL